MNIQNSFVQSNLLYRVCFSAAGLLNTRFTRAGTVRDHGKRIKGLKPLERRNLYGKLRIDF